MAVIEYLHIDTIQSSGEDIMVTVNNKVVSVHSMATDATYFHFDLGAADWELLKKYVDEKLKSKK